MHAHAHARVSRAVYFSWSWLLYRQLEVPTMTTEVHVVSLSFQWVVRMPPPKGISY